MYVITIPRRRALARALALALATALLALATSATLVGTARADWGLTHFTMTMENADGTTAAAQAGAHPYAVTTSFGTTLSTNAGGFDVPDQNLKDVQVDLPPGLLGDPTAVPRCRHEQLATQFLCPADTQIGIVTLHVANAEPANPTAIYNMEPPPGVPAQFGFTVVGNVAIYLNASVRTGGDYGVRITVPNLSSLIPAFGTDLTLWGVPADPSHDAQRCRDLTVGTPAFCSGGGPTSTGVPSDAPLAPFLTNPTSCGPEPLRATLSATPWLHRDQVLTATTTARGPAAGGAAEVRMTGCEKLDFAPTVDVRPESPSAGAPSGYAVTVGLPQNDGPGALATAHLRRAVVTLPAGTVVSPSSADGLGACSPGQIGLHDPGPAACPEAAKIGTVAIDTPLLDEPLTGAAYLAQQTRNPFGSLLALYLVAEGQGVRIKLAGRIDPDPLTGRLVATFDDTPQLPFTELRLRLKGGARAPLANPRACGAHAATAAFGSWAGGGASSASTFAIDGCAPRRFAPKLAAGGLEPTAGRAAPFSFRLTRDDADDELRDVRVALPRGVLGRVSSIVPCPDAAAAAGTCGPDSQIGTVTAGAGPGSSPFFITNGRAYFTEGYRGAPFGLSMVVPAVAGPLDLGTVVVRAAVHIDPHTAQVTVETDPLPRILQGIPLQLRDLRVTLDRPGFMLTPTRCARQEIQAAVGATTGATATLTAPFAVTGCDALRYAPKLALSLRGRGQTTDGRHPALTARLSPRAGDANTRRVRVVLPLSLALEPENANGLCEPSAAAAGRCPASSIVGSASATTPVLRGALRGPVYFVRGERKDPKSGRTIRTLPKLYVPLTGPDGVKIELGASSTTVRHQLVTTFDDLPDAPLSSFQLDIAGGRHGILVVSGTDVCKATQVADAELDGQNGKAADQAVTMATPCPLRVVGSSHDRRFVRVKVSGLGAGRVSVGGPGLRRSARTLRSATTATVRVPMGAAMRRALAQGRDVRVRLTVAFTPRGERRARRATARVTVHGA